VKRHELRVAEGEDKHVFAAGALIESLQAAGVPTEEAVRVVRDVERHLRNEGALVVRGAELVDRLAAEVAERVGVETAEAVRRQTPPFAPLEVDEDGSATPFDRRLLAASLERAGISFKDANLLAQQIESSLRSDGVRVVKQRVLLHRAAAALEARFGRETLLRFEATVARFGDLVVTENGRDGLPYSRGILAQSLMGIGLEPERSHNFAKRVEDVLWRRGEQRVSRALIRAAVHELLLEEAGEEYARRYLVMRRVRASERPIVVVVGGTAGVGKSVIAAQIAYRLGIARVVSTDSVRQALRSLISPELSPVLHASSFTAWRAELMPHEVTHVKLKRNRVVRGFQTQVMQLGTAVDAIISRHLSEGTSLVIEGIHLVPGLTPRVRDPAAVVVPLVLAVRDEDDHREHFGRREGHTRARRPSSGYLEHFDAIRMLQDYLVTSAKREAVSVIDIGDVERAVDRGVELVLDAVMEELGLEAVDPRTVRLQR
jgi:2-phosphoglycerate kinase